MTATEGAAALIAESDWLALSTIDEAGRAASSYVPFASAGDAFAIAISGLAAHTRHLQARPEASVLFVGERPAGGDAFARPRLAVRVRARYVEGGSPTSDALWDTLERRHGKTVRALRDLPDFVTLRLEPQHARIVLGFATASDLDATALREILQRLPSA